MQNSPLLSVQHLSRYYGNLPAVKNVQFDLAQGEVLGFLGPNGAGKSTTMNMITGNLAPSQGKIQVCGIDLMEQPRQAKAEIGYLPEQPPLYKDFTVDEYLRFCARINQISRNKISTAIDNAKQRCGLDQVGKRLINNLSKGYQQRVGIAQAIIHSPSIVILDEPTVGLDPIQIREIRSLIRDLGNEHGVILSTHILPEVQMTCDRVQIINQGHLVFTDSIHALQERMLTQHHIVGFKRPPADTTLLSLSGIENVESLDDGRIRLQHAESADFIDTLVSRAVAENWGITELIPEHKTLEQIFVEITTSEQNLEKVTQEEVA